MNEKTINRDEQWEILARMVGEDVPSTDDLDVLFSHEGRYSVFATYFLLASPSNQVENFLKHTLFQLLSRLASKSERIRQETVGEIRGRIDWPQTQKARVENGWNGNVFVCRKVDRHLDRPENRVLRALIAAIARCLNSVPSWMRNGVGYGKERAIPSLPRIRTMESTIALAKKHVLFSELQDNSVSDNDLFALDTSRIRGYEDVLKIYRYYDRFVLQGTWDAIFEKDYFKLPLPGELSTESLRWIRLAKSCGQASKVTRK